jgi:uncharacterized SAM-binding protein YcdF (DUF218 family)
MSWFFTNVIAAFLLPPLSLLLLFGLGIFMLYRRSKFAKPFLLTTFCLSWIACTPYFTEGAIHLLEARTVALDDKPPVAGAIVILGGGTYFNAPEYAKQDTVTGFVLERLRYGAKLGRETGTPILVTGGKPLDSDTAEAVLMQMVLEQEFHTPVRWIEDSSNNTYENALYSFQTLQKSGIKKIYLVTHAWHMPRAATVFRKVGFEVVEAPTAFNTRYQIDLLAFLPQAEAMQNSKIVAHEVIGMLWYRLKSSLTNQTLKEKPI